MLETLEQIATIFGEEKISFDHYSKILKIGLSVKELGQIPQTQDKVTVGDVNRSKTHKVKTVFVIGVNDGVFPSIHTSEGFFNDKDRQNLKEQNFELAKGTREKMYEENFNIYKVFSTAEEKLYISYSSSDSDGKALRKSLLISKIKRIFPNLLEKDKLKDEVLTKTITFSKLLNNHENPDWNEVFRWYEDNERKKLDSALRGLKYTNVPCKINNENIRKLYGNVLKTSVSKLESYRSCPFSYFLKYGLRVSEKEKLDVKPIDTGSFMHDIIDRFFKIIKDNNKNVKEVTDSQIKEIVEVIVQEKTNYNGKFTLTAKYRTLVQRLIRVVTSSLKYIIESLRESEFDVLETEAVFDTNKDSTYQPIEMELDDGRKVSIIGKIDRIDIAKMPDGKYIRVIDYKSSTKDIDLNKVISGLQLQLITYADAICENDNVFPSGALYFTLLEPKIAQRNLGKEEIENLLKENYRMNGLVLADINVIKAMDTSLESGKSNKIPVTLNKNGEISFSKSRTLTRSEFENLQRYTNKIIREISKQILRGDISLTPYYTQKEKSTPCQYCAYKSICQFNSKFKNNDYRYIPNDKKEEVLKKIKDIQINE
ncbi:MAG: PD-(D/E)XK nuclease family protein [Clostridia bacterium]|nr:PD-(D/E)XK nuclease family protein [Clostridia bacterium]